MFRKQQAFYASWVIAIREDSTFRLVTHCPAVIEQLAVVSLSNPKLELAAEVFADAGCFARIGLLHGF